MTHTSTQNAIDSLGKLVNATITRYSSDPAVIIPTLTRLLAITVVTESLTDDWPATRLRAVDDYNSALISTKEQLTTLLAMEQGENDA